MLKKSVIIAGRHSTSISIEPEFYEELTEIAKKERCSITGLITKIDSQRSPSNNLSSAIRVYILNYIKNS
ncbi:MAG: ribbon-helix-helix domain-containing protein [Alphaproteobacteria bacterium]|nr:ribbon-helix-helix domain-containing protein [Alphaproteobacteria bacterium]